MFRYRGDILSVSMTSEEKEMLQKLVDANQGLLSPSEFFAGICKRNEKSAHNLISHGLVDEVPNQVHGRDYLFYRAAEKGRAVFYPIHQKAWYWFKGDVRTIIVALITAILTTFVTTELF